MKNLSEYVLNVSKKCSSLLRQITIVTISGVSLLKYGDKNLTNKFYSLSNIIEHLKSTRKMLFLSALP